MKGKTLLRVVMIVAAALVVIVVGAVIVVRLMFPPEKIKALVIPQVETALGRQVKVDKVGLSVFPVLGVSMTGIEIANTSRAGFSVDPFVKLDRFLVEISFMSIFKGYPEISQVILEKPQIRIEVNAAGKYNYDDLAVLGGSNKGDTVQKEEKKGGMPMLPVPITLKKFEIRNGMISYVDNKAKQEVVIGDMEQTIKVSIDKELRNIATTGNLVLSRVSLKTKDIAKPLSNLTITFTHDIGANLVDGNADVRQIRLSLQKLFITMKGSVSGLNSTPSLDLTVASDPIQIKDLLAEVPPELAPVLKDLSADGMVELGLVIKGALKDSGSLPLKGRLGIKNGTIRYKSLPKSINNLNADIAFTDNSLNIGSLNMNLGENPIAVKGTVVNFSKPVIDIACNARVDLGDVKDVVEIPKDASLAGLVIADVKAKGEADPAHPEKLDLKGTVDFKDLKVLWSPLLKPAFINGSFSLSSKAIGENLTVKDGESSLLMSASVSNYLTLILGDSTRHLPRPMIDFKMTSSFLNVDEILKPQDTAGQAAEQKSDDNGPMIAPMPGIDMKGTISANAIIYKGIKMANMVAQINVINDIADVNFKTGFAGGSIANVIHGDLRNVHKVAITNKCTVDKVEVNDLMQYFGKNIIKPTTALNRELLSIQNSLFGKVNLTSTLNTNGSTADDFTKSLAGNVSLNMNDGRITNTPVLKNVSSAVGTLAKSSRSTPTDAITFKSLSVLVNIADGRATFNDFKILSDEGDWDAKGSVGFDATLAMQVVNKLSKASSAAMLGAENSIKNMAQNALQGTQFASAAGLLNNVNVIPRDRDGRVSVRFNLEGTVSSPKVVGIGFGEGGGGSSAPQKPAAKPSVKNQINQAISQNRDAASKAVLGTQQKQQIDQLKKQAVDKLKKLF